MKKLIGISVLFITAIVIIMFKQYKIKNIAKEIYENPISLGV